MMGRGPHLASLLDDLIGAIRRQRNELAVAKADISELRDEVDRLTAENDNLQSSLNGARHNM